MTGLAVHSNGAVYVTGTTNAPDYPITSGLPAGQVFAGELEPISAAWFAKISGDGSKVLYAGAEQPTTRIFLQRAEREHRRDWSTA